MPGQGDGITDLTKTFDSPRGSRSTTNCRPGRQAGKVRGAVSAGQGFVSANLRFPRCSGLAVLFGLRRHQVGDAGRLGECRATIFRPSPQHWAAPFAKATKTLIAPQAG